MPNNLTARKDGAWLVISMVPDVCKTPVGSAIVPIPYPIIAQCGSATKEVPHVRANGTPLITLASYIPTTTGNQPGVQKGIKSSTVGGTASFKGGQHSSTVNADKQRILRHGDMFWMNGKASGLAPNKPVQKNPPSAEEISLAKTEGATPEQVAARKKVADSFYEQQGMPPSKIAGHTNGIDFSKPVEVASLAKGKKVSQYQVPNGPQGNYYSEPGVEPSKLGISGTAKDWNSGKIVQKQANSYETNNRVDVLKSSAAKIDDTWSIPGKTIKTDGGETQFFTMEKGSFKSF